MSENMKIAYECGKKVSCKLDSKKLKSKVEILINLVNFKKYDKVIKNLLELSNTTGVEFGFIYCLIDNFEENKNVLYTFLSATVKSDEE